uniref:Uncharacterized protein n=1 Tax=Cannabis sativa TaxID=3483 RepID=A0A803NSL3_CANSA
MRYHTRSHITEARPPPRPYNPRPPLCTVFWLWTSTDQLLGRRGTSSTLWLISSKPHPPPRSVKDALKALFGIALYPLNRGSMIELGAVPALFSLVLKDGRVGIVEDATAVVAQVAGCEESEEASRKVSGTGVLVDLLDPATGSSLRTKENAVAALLNLGRCGGEKAVREIKEMGLGGDSGAVEGTREVAASGSAKGKAKAVALLTMIDVGNELRSGNENGNRILYGFSDSGFDSLVSRSSSN